MSSIIERRRIVALLLALPALSILSISGCGGETEQRKSGTLVVPLDFVEKAGEVSGKKEDAAKGASKKK